MKKIFACALSATMLISSFSNAFAYAPSHYDGQAYGNVGYTSEDPDGEINLAITAKGDVKFVGDGMYVKGSVYSAGDIYVGNGAGNKVDGFFISAGDGSLDSGNGTTADRKCHGYIHVDDDGNREDVNAYSTILDYAGAIIDLDTSFECSYKAFAIPEIENNLGDVTANIYGGWNNDGPITVSKDTRIENLDINGNAVTIDTTAGDVNLVIDNMKFVNPGFSVVGNNKANIYIGNVSNLHDLFVNYDVSAWPPVMSGNVDNTHLYFTGDDVEIKSSKIAVADITINAKSLTVTGSSEITSDFITNVDKFKLYGSTSITGTVCAPNAASQIVDTGTLYGQIHTNTIDMNGNGQIIYKADSAVEEATPTPKPTPDNTPEPTEAPLMPTGPAKSYNGFKYAYIFGYEPYNMDDGSVMLRMAPEEKVTREQVCAMLVRIDDQYNNKIGKTRYLEDGIFNSDVDENRWSYNALAAVAETKAFYNKTDLEPGSHISRGEVARIVAFMMGLTQTDDSIVFSDAVGDENEVYINLVAVADYMQGYEDGTFQPAAAITRAEFCSLINNVIGRDSDEGYLLETAEGDPVTHDTYHFSDLKPSAWYYETMLYATSAFDGRYVDLETRNQNIRNKLDGYVNQDGETQFEY